MNREALRYVLAVGMVGIGILHFTNAPAFVSIMPPYLPWHLELVYLSGAIEIGLGLLLLPRATRNFAAWSLIALYLAVYPANIHMALHEVTVQGLPPGVEQPSRLMAWLRLPFQLVFIYWAYQYTDRAEATRGARRAGSVDSPAS